MALPPVSGAILIIDDEAALRQTLTRILRQAGYDVTTAADGAEALQRTASANYDLVYLDLHLPGLSGLQVLRELHRLNPYLPVILFTAYASLQSAVEALRLGATDYLVKPIAPETLLSRTRAALAEQLVERHRREIRQQIENLQNELRNLEIGAAPPPAVAAPAAPGNRFIKSGSISLDLQARRVTVGTRNLTLPQAALDYLVVLARHAPAVVDYQTLIAEAQGYQTGRREAQELAKWHIHVLRDALEPNPKQPRYILNVRGTGYRLVTD